VPVPVAGQTRNIAGGCLTRPRFHARDGEVQRDIARYAGGAACRARSGQSASDVGDGLFYVAAKCSRIQLFAAAEPSVRTSSGTSTKTYS
jgi:hypothetical protein